jgi:surface antigen
MFKAFRTSCVLTLCCFSFVACANMPGATGQAGVCRVFGTQKQLIGAVAGGATGAAVGQAVGRNTTSTLIGAASGVLLGGLVGTMLDQRDCEIAQAALRQQAETAPTNSRVANWKNTQTNNSGFFQIAPPYRNPKTGQICRQFKSTIKKGGGSVSESTEPGVTCRTPEGDWVVQ